MAETRFILNSNCNAYRIADSTSKPKILLRYQVVSQRLHLSAELVFRRVYHNQTKIYQKRREESSKLQPKKATEQGFVAAIASGLQVGYIEALCRPYGSLLFQDVRSLYRRGAAGCLAPDAIAVPNGSSVASVQHLVLARHAIQFREAHCHIDLGYGTP